MTIRTKLLIAIASPLIVLALLSANTLYDSWQVSTEMASMRRLTDFASSASALVHETQKERGATAGFLGNPEGKFADRLQKQRQLTDQRLAEFEAFLANFDLARYGEEFSQQVKAAEQGLGQLRQKRSAISARKLPTGEAIAYYTKLNGQLLDSIGKSALATENSNIAVKISAYTAFLKSKERAGIERAVLANTFAADKFGPLMYEKFTALVALQDSYLQEFLNLASESDRKFYESKIKSPAVTKVQAYRKIAVERAQQGNFGQDAGEWFDTITEKINELKQVDDHLATSLAADADHAASAANTKLWTLLGVISTVVCLVTLGGWFAISAITRRLATVTERIRDIAEGDADLTARLDFQPDEIGVLSQWFNAMLDRIEKIIANIGQTSTELTDAAEQLVTTAESMKTGADQSKSQSSTISSAIEEMSINMNQTAETTKSMSAGISSVSESLEAMRSSIQEVASRSQESASIAQSATDCVEVGNTQISSLGNAAQEIGNVINVIQDIAEQTNLLALNATIEAARAGEAGKGFAVVATEVKELANQTAEATDGIRERVLAMQECATQTVTAMANIDEVIQNVRNASDTIASAVVQQTESVSAISTNMQQSSASSQQIAGGVRESALASREITESVTVVDRTLKDTAQGAELTHTAGTTVASLAAELKQQISQFKTR